MRLFRADLVLDQHVLYSTLGREPSFGAMNGFGLAFAGYCTACILAIAREEECHCG